MTEWRLVATTRERGKSRLASPFGARSAPDPSIESLATTARKAKNGDGTARLFVSGGEPTLRADLPLVIAKLAESGQDVGLACDALALAADGALNPLVDAGLRRVRVTLHAARADAHDWLVGQPGAAKRVVRAIGRARALGLGVEIAATVTRSTMPLIGELCELAASVGVERVLFSRVVVRETDDLVVLTPRFGLLEPYLVNAVAIGIEKKVSVELHGFPECAARRARKSFVPRGGVRWLVPDGMPEPIEPESLAGCPSCPGLPRCGGAPRDYVERFGATEFRSEQLTGEGGALLGVEPGVAAVPPPPPRANRAPVTRLEPVRTLIGRELGGDPLLDKLAAVPPRVLRFRFPAPSRIACPICSDGPSEVEATRNLRARLVRAAQEGAHVLRIASAGSLAHPKAAALLREATLLSYERVEVAGEASALASASDAELYALKGITRFDIALFGPDAETHDAHVGRAGAFEAARSTAERIAKLAGAQIGSYAVLHDEQLVAGFARAWENGALLGDPCFRLSPLGGDLRALAAVAAKLPDGPGRTALARVLPTCVFPRENAPPPLDGGTAFEEALDPSLPPSASDRCGTFEPCVWCGETASCTGMATGWTFALPT